LAESLVGAYGQNGAVLLADIARTSAAVAATPARSAKVALLAECLSRAGAGEVPVAVSYLSGELRQRKTGLGYAALRDRPLAAETPTLQLTQVDTAFEGIAAVSGPGSVAERRRLFSELMSRATVEEQHLLRGLVAGELRQGALDGVMLDAVAKATGLPPSEVRRAVMLRGAVGPVAEALLVEGAVGLDRFRLEVGRPMRPMLAQSAPSTAEAFARISPAAVEWKLDGIRVQVHRSGADVAVYTRTLDDVTARLPEVVEAARTLPVESVVLDGEVIALRQDGRPHPFQVTGSRVAQRAPREPVPLTTFVFDCLHLDGSDLLGLGAAERRAALERVCPPSLLVPRIVTAEAAEADAFLRDAVARGHEGVVVKALDVPYEAGRRGASWVKVKPRHTLDLVVLAAEWGHGRRQGWLSNLHLGARDPETGGFVMLGKTFKGLTDAMLQWQTERLLELAESRDRWIVHVRPELVVEVAFDGVQASPRYPAGMALRFARVLRHRPDKRADEADTVDDVRAIHAAGG
jgi:ATP-dependent DNA ligase I